MLKNIDNLFIMMIYKYLILVLVCLSVFNVNVNDLDLVECIIVYDK